MDFLQNVGGELDAVALSLRETTVTVEPSTSSSPRAVNARRGNRVGTQGAGIVWAADGTIVTNAHVATTETAAIRFADGRTTTAKLVARDERRDLALLRANVDALQGTLRSSTIGEPSGMRAGDVVLALGHPLGVEHALAMGVVHATPSNDSPYVVADIKLAPGNSGGPLTDVRGRIIGVNSMIVGGLGVAVSVDVVRGMLAAAAPRPSLGAELRPVRVRVPAGSSTTQVALLVLGLQPRGAAARGGILPGDLLFGHAGRPFTSTLDLLRVLHDAGPGGVLRLDVGRGGRKTTCEITLGPATSERRRAA